MIEPLISVVIPIYKVEKYLNRCIQSIVNQTYKNLEIIMVDDGSPDNCPHICDKWAKTDDRILVIHKKNEGLGMARNSGMSVATGEYICFFDSDDFIALDTIEKCVNSIKKYSPDFVVFGYRLLDSNLKILNKRIPNTDKEYYSGEEVISKILHAMVGADTKIGKTLNLNMSSCMALFSMKTIIENDWKFVSESEYISEDFYSIFSFFRYVKSISIIKEDLYSYCYNGKSLTHKYDQNRFNKINFWHKGMVKLLDECHYPNFFISDLASQYLGSVIGCLKLICISNNKKEYIEIHRILSDEYFLNTINEINSKSQTINRRIFIYLIKLRAFFFCYLIIKLKK